MGEAKKASIFPHRRKGSWRGGGSPFTNLMAGGRMIRSIWAYVILIPPEEEPPNRGLKEYRVKLLKEEKRGDGNENGEAPELALGKGPVQLSYDP